jgi:LmbE family N-acetylglucosaminyl deacetylase
MVVSVSLSSSRERAICRAARHREVLFVFIAPSEAFPVEKTPGVASASEYGGEPKYFTETTRAAMSARGAAFFAVDGEADMKKVPDQLRPFVSRVLLGLLRRRARALPGVDSRPLLVVVPHQDDETLGCGGMIALKRRSGATVAVAYTTDGGNSHAGHPVLTPERLVPMRRKEARAALGTLGVPEEDVHFFDGPDGGLAQLGSPQRERLLAGVLGLLERYQPGQVCVTFRRDEHPDHDTTYALVVEALQAWGKPVELLEFPVWVLWLLRRVHLSRPEFVGMQKLDISAVRSLKHRAIACFETQVKSTAPRHDMKLPAGFVRRFRGRWELFLVTKPNDG